MTQNTSHAVMAQRSEPHTSLDDFPTPPWATRALMERLGFQEGHCWEPACNRGHMAQPLREYFRDVLATDIHNYGWPEQRQICDFLIPGCEPNESRDGIDWIITNPPFRLAEQFALRALDIATVGVALFVRLAFLETIDRYNHLFNPYPPALILQFAERVVLHKGKLAPKGSTATAYCWVIWAKHRGNRWPGTRFEWIAPCRKRLEREEDYT